MYKTCRKRMVMYLIAALFCTLLCFSVVHNAAIKQAPGRASNSQQQRQDSMQESAKAVNIESKYGVNALDSNAIESRGAEALEQEGHAFEPDSLDLKLDNGAQVLSDLNINHKNNEANNVQKNIDIDQGDYIKADTVIQSDAGDQRKDGGDAAWNKDAALRFDAEEAEDHIPEGQIFGVGERVVDDPKPLPIIKAPRQIDALVDARREGEQQVIADDPLELDDLEPPDHLDAVRMEQDGHINRKYHREVFFGEHEEFDNLSDDEMAKKLEEIFYKVDTSGNGFITVDELEDWIVQKTNEHFVEAKRENDAIFNSLDTDSNGFISWEEFEVQFLMALGNKEEDAKLYAQGRDEDIPLDIEDRERLIRYKFKWSEAEQEPVDNRLNADEFQGFRHPESSSTMLQQMVDDILESLDLNKDGYLTEKEFISMPPSEYDYNEIDRNWQKQRRKEFNNIIDTDHDGKVTRSELLSYVDPQNPNHAKMEARNLLELGDSNGDDRLSLQEVVDNMDLFYGSKMVNTGLSFHDEF